MQYEASYKILDATLSAASDVATYTRKRGGVASIPIAVEGTKAEAFGEYVSAQNNMIFSASTADLTLAGVAFLPEEGDEIAGAFGSIGQARYKVVKDASTGRAWDWRFPRPGYRVTFEGARIV